MQTETKRKQESMGMSLSKLQEFVMDKETWHTAIHGVAKSWIRLSNWTELNWIIREKNLKKNIYVCVCIKYMYNSHMYNWTITNTVL